MFIKHFINVIYFFEVLGLHKVYSYTKHEFFTIKEKRSFLGGHFSNQKNAPTTFLVPLRIFLGVMWLMSGIAKVPGIMDDWTKVSAFPNKATRYNIVVKKDDVDTSSAATTQEEPKTDTTSSATGEEYVEESNTDATTEATTDDNTKPVVKDESDFVKFAHNMGAIFELKAAKPSPTFGLIDGMMNWAYETFFWDGDTGFTTLAAVFQSGMIVAEIVVGLMFIIGFLTPIAAILSFIMMIAIYMSGWSYISIFFYGFASLACIFSGNSFGVDYYLLPIIDQKLRSMKFTKKWYLYFK